MAATSSTQKVIAFYEVKERPYGAFSNYAPYPVRVDGILYPTTEHYYQACKFDDAWYREQILRASTPNKARELAQMKDTPTHRYPWRRELNFLIQAALQRGIKLRDDWEEQKEVVMYKALEAKFTQHPELKKLLLSTADAPIEEASPRDAYWGTGCDGEGRNRLGELLMLLRAEFIANRIDI